MLRNGEVFLGFEEVERDDDIERVFLSVDRSLLQRRQRLGPGHRNRVGAERLEGVDIDGVLHQTDLEPFHVFGRFDGAFAVGQVAESALSVGESLAPELLHARQQLFADLAVEDLVGLLRRREEEGKIEHAEFGQEVDDRTACDDSRIHDAHPHAFKKLALVPKGRVGENLDLDFALAPRFHEFLELQRARMERVLLVHDMRKLDRGRRHRRKGKTQYEKKTQNRRTKPLVHRSSPFQNW